MKKEKKTIQNIVKNDSSIWSIVINPILVYRFNQGNRLANRNGLAFEPDEEETRSLVHDLQIYLTSKIQKTRKFNLHFNNHNICNNSNNI